MENVEKNIVEQLGGTVDVIGLDVIYLQKKVEDFTKENAIKQFEENSKEVYDILDVDGEQYLIKATFANLNKNHTCLPEDMEQSLAMKVQFKIADVLSNAGLNVNMTPEGNDVIKETIEEEDVVEDEEIETVTEDVEVV